MSLEKQSNKIKGVFEAMTYVVPCYCPGRYQTHPKDSIVAVQGVITKVADGLEHLRPIKCQFEKVCSKRGDRDLCLLGKEIASCKWEVTK